LEGHCLSYGDHALLPVLDLPARRMWGSRRNRRRRHHRGRRCCGGLQAVGWRPREGPRYLLYLLGVGAEVERLAGVSPER